jgi:hypothetical protein
MVDRFAGLDLHHRLQTMTAIRRHQDEVGVERRRTNAHRRVLFVARVHPGVELALELRVQQPDQPIVLELLADGPHQNRTQQAPPNDWISTA